MLHVTTCEHCREVWSSLWWGSHANPGSVLWLVSRGGLVGRSHSLSLHSQLKLESSDRQPGTPVWLLFFLSVSTWEFFCLACRAVPCPLLSSLLHNGIYHHEEIRKVNCCMLAFTFGSAKMPRLFQEVLGRKCLKWDVLSFGFGLHWLHSSTD